MVQRKEEHKQGAGACSFKLKVLPFMLSPKLQPRPEDHPTDSLAVALKVASRLANPIPVHLYTVPPSNTEKV